MMRTLQLFNKLMAPKAGASFVTDAQYDAVVKELLGYGLYITPDTPLTPKLVTQLRDFARNNRLNDQTVNSTFYRRWDEITSKTRLELFRDQILHYFTTYGMTALGLYDKDLVYVPAKDIELELPEGTQIPVTIIKLATSAEMKELVFEMLESGVALKEETLSQLLAILRYDVEIKPTSEDMDRIMNREALCRFAVDLKVMPKSAVEQFRVILYQTTGSSMIIKDDATLEKVSQSGVRLECELRKMAEIFNRFKPIFMAFKNAHRDNRTIVNRISKLSKTYHKPFIEDPLSRLTSTGFMILKETLLRKLSRATSFRLVSLLQAIDLALRSPSYSIYRIRNGKVWVKANNNTFLSPQKEQVLLERRELVYNELVERTRKNVEGKYIAMSPNLIYAVPTSEKNFLGNIPEGTYINCGDKDIILGIHWFEKDGTRDFDLSMMSNGARIGWNAAYTAANIVFSGDMTHAPSPDGATELFYVKKMISDTYTLHNSRYSGSEGSTFRFLVAQEKATNFDRNYMVNPSNIIFQAPMVSKERNQYLGMLSPNHVSGGMKFTFLNFEGGGGNRLVAKSIPGAREALELKHAEPLSLTQLLKDAGALVVAEKNVMVTTEDNVPEEQPVDIDLSFENLDKSTLIKLIK